MNQQTTQRAEARIACGEWIERKQTAMLEALDTLSGILTLGETKTLEAKINKNIDELLKVMNRHD